MQFNSDLFAVSQPRINTSEIDTLKNYLTLLQSIGGGLLLSFDDFVCICVCVSVSVNIFIPMRYLEDKNIPDTEIHHEHYLHDVSRFQINLCIDSPLYIALIIYQIYHS